MQGVEYNIMHNSGLPIQTPCAEQQQYVRFSQDELLHVPQPQPHSMPSPTAAPWSLAAMPWQLASTSANALGGGVMRFNAQRLDPLHQKRKSDSPIPAGPTKQFISEEKFTAHFNGLHISSDYIQNSDNSFVESIDSDEMPSTSGRCFTNLTYQDYQVTAKELEEKLKNASRIIMVDEVAKKLQEEQKKAAYLPQVLTNRIERPCTALVLWQPPPLSDLLQQNQPLKNKNNHSIKQSTMLYKNNSNKLPDYLDESEDDEFFDVDADIDDLIDNNNTCSVDFNNLKPDGMDEDL